MGYLQYVAKLPLGRWLTQRQLQDWEATPAAVLAPAAPLHHLEGAQVAAKLLLPSHHYCLDNLGDGLSKLKFQETPKTCKLFTS